MTIPIAGHEILIIARNNLNFPIGFLINLLN